MSLAEAPILGVEAGGTTLRAALFNAQGTLLAQARFSTGTPDDFLEALERWLAALSARPTRAGVASFGPLHESTLRHTPKRAWEGFDWALALGKLVHGPVACDTDVNLAALAEWHSRPGTDSLAYITVGTGIGAGLVREGTIFRGALHPEAGHLLLGRETDDTYTGCCPFHGACWEGLASATALRGRWGLDPAEVPDAHPSWDLEARYLARGALALVYTWQPRVLVLGGGVMTRSFLLERVRTEMARLSGSYLGSELENWTHRVQAPLLPDSGLMGAFLLARAAA